MLNFLSLKANWLRGTEVPSKVSWTKCDALVKTDKKRVWIYFWISEIETLDSNLSLNHHQDQRLFVVAATRCVLKDDLSSKSIFLVKKKINDIILQVSQSVISLFFFNSGKKFQIEPIKSKDFCRFSYYA